MAAPTFDVTYPEQRNRLTVAFRFITALPHMVVAAFWGYFAELLAVVQCFIVLFTGKRNDGIWKLQAAYWQYYGRVVGYSSLLHDVFPPFGTEVGAVPVQTTITNDEPVNRLTNALRAIWVLPAAIIGAALMILALVLQIISWFVIIITGNQSPGMWGFIEKAVRYLMQVLAYSLLMTDSYPKYG